MRKREKEEYVNFSYGILELSCIPSSFGSGLRLGRTTEQKPEGPGSSTIKRYRRVYLVLTVPGERSRSFVDPNVHSPFSWFSRRTAYMGDPGPDTRVSLPFVLGPKRVRRDTLPFSVPSTGSPVPLPPNPSRRNKTQSPRSVPPFSRVIPPRPERKECSHSRPDAPRGVVPTVSRRDVGLTVVPSELSMRTGLPESHSEKSLRPS